jgi:hypothetical protein
MFTAGSMAGPPAEAAKRVDGDFGLLQGGANDVEAAVAEQKFEIGAAGLAPAALGFAYALAVATDHSPGAAGGAGGDMTIRKKLIEVSISLEAIESRWRATQER